MLNVIRRISEEIIHESTDARTETLVSLRELGPPDLVHLLKQNLRNASKQVRPVPIADIATAPFPNAHSTLDRSISPRYWC
jgi:hypothetical protein